MKGFLKSILILTMILCFALPAFAVKILPYNMPLHDIMSWDERSATLKIANPEGETVSVAWASTVDLWNYDGATWTFDLPTGDTFAFSKGVAVTGVSSITGATSITGAVTITGAVGITGDVTLASTSKLYFLDTGLYIYSSANGVLDVVSDTTLNLTAGVGTYSFSATTLNMGALTITNVGTITATNVAGPTIINAAATISVPTLCPNRAETDTGIGWTTDALHIVLGGATKYNFSTTALTLVSGNNLVITQGSLDMASAATGTAYVKLADSVVDALSVIRGASTDMMVFDTSTPRVTITPAVTIIGALDIDTTANATSISTGAFQVVGGIGAGGFCFFAQNTGVTAYPTGLYETLTITGAVSGSAVGFRSIVVMGGTSKAVGNMLGISCAARLTNAEDVISGAFAGLLSGLDMGLATTAGLWAYSIECDLTEIVTRASSPRAFINFQDYDAAGGYPVLYVFDFGGALSNFATTTGKIYYNNTLKVAVNNTARWIPLSTAEGSYTTSVTLADNTTKALSITSTVATNGSGFVQSYFESEMTTIGGAGVCTESYMKTNVALGNYVASFYSVLDLQTAGGVTGVGSAICGELVLPGGAAGIGTFGVLKLDVVCPANWTSSQTVSFFRIRSSGSTVATFINNGYLFDIADLGTPVDDTVAIWHLTKDTAPTHALRVRVDGVAYDILMQASQYSSN